MKQMLTSLSTIVVLAYLGFGLLLYLMQDSFLYYPTRETQVAGAEEVTFSLNNETIKGFVVNPGHPHALVYYGGNAEEIGHNARLLGPNLPDTTLYLINYRGYGGSSGTPSQKNLFDDAIALYDELKANHADISVIGRSLGSGVAAHLAANRDVEKLILVTPYDSIESLAKDQYPVYPVSFMLRDKYRSIDLTHKIKAPTLILIAQLDQLIPPEKSLTLAAAFPQHQVQVETIEGAEHSSISGYPEYSKLIGQFF